ncbi:MAG: sulfotransferase [Dokdonella sp.]
MHHVPFAQRYVARWLGALPALGPALAMLESSVLRAEIDVLQPGPPVWICGMARAGSTILLEVLNSVPSFTSHRYGDYPWLWTPYWRNWLRARLPQDVALASERAHRDRLTVTPESPEAFEEAFWMQAFPGRHDPSVDQRLASEQSSEHFDRTFDDHQRKLLLIRGAQRYLAKANYQLPRIAYLLRRYPEARFVISVREPFAQVESLRRQDALFRKLHAEDSAVSAHMARVGHFEFGPQKRAYNLGNDALTATIGDHFSRDETVAGFARQWAVQYGYALDLMHSDPAIAHACLWVGFDKLCADPANELARIARHVGVELIDAHRLVTDWTPRISAPAHPPIEWLVAQREDVEHVTGKLWQSIQPLLRTDVRG